ncbi:MAG: PrsW family intramembrane metalloprotease [Bacteroidales bacterium]|nr:PrsW family intramembrane metalloprotease [Candidatus Colimorpha onthohippi]
MLYIIRNSQQYGPYSIDVIRQYVEGGQILLHDQIFDDAKPNEICPVKSFLRAKRIKVKIPQKGSLLSQIKAIGQELIFPKGLLNSSPLKSDKRLLVLSIVGLVPLLLISLIGWLSDIFPFIVFYSISLYFSIIWGLFFFYLFKTSQVSVKKTVLIFFLTQIAVFFIFGIGANYLNPFYFLQGKIGFVGRLLYYVFAVGVTEEIVKAIPIWIVLSKAKEPMIPQTMVFYGLMSGIAFGVFEGVQYQMGVNVELDYTGAFFMNIARLTCLPFLHAIWCGIAGYFSAFAHLYPKYRKGLYCLAIAIPALLHGVYDTFGGGLIGVLVSFVGVVLLMTYLRTGVNYQSKLRM